MGSLSSPYVSLVRFESRGRGVLPVLARDAGHTGARVGSVIDRVLRGLVARSGRAGPVADPAAEGDESVTVAARP